ncbi:MAG TPA: glycoside hydrolase family 88 protein [Bacteroidales bacterium]|nr:glycoside hydrolase family 88 protein [Bacteroidales bacterium]
MKKLAVVFLLLTLVVSSRAQTEKKFFKPQYIKKAMTKALDWQLAHPKHKLYDWTNGAFYTGVFSAYQTLQKPYILDSLVAMGNRNQWKPGPRIHHADDWTICQTYIDVYRIKKDQRMIQPFIDTLKVFSNSYNVEAGKHGITWWWCDALFMGPPALVKLARTVNDNSYLTMNDTLYKQTYDLLFDTEELLFARDAKYLWKGESSDMKETNGKKIFWGRGNGWVMGGLVKVISELPASHPTRSFYVDIYKQMAQKLIVIQQPDGFWRTSLLDPNAYPGGEASGTGFFCYALAWGINQGILDKETYLPVVKKAWVALCKAQKETGMIGWVQPIGADPQKNFSADSWEVYGTGAFLSAGSEVIKLNVK